MDRGAWWAIVHGVTKSWTQLKQLRSSSRVQFWGWKDPLEKGMATHCSILAWRIPLTEEPGGLQSMGLQRVEHD